MIALYSVLWRNDKGYQESRDALDWWDVTALVQRLNDRGIFEVTIETWSGEK